MKFRVEIRDTSFTTQYILDNEYYDLSWSYSAKGGCGEFSFYLPRKLFEERAISGEYNVRIYFRDPSTDSFVLRYQGLIENKLPSVQGLTEKIQITGHGYYTQLGRVYINNITYTSTEISAIVTNILDNYIVPNTNISYSASNIQNTGITLSSIQFNEYADTALQKLADIAGNVEYGVDMNRNFYFKTQSTSVGFNFPVGFKIQNYDENQDFKSIINRVYVQGAQAGGTYAFFGPYDHAGSQLKYNLRVKVQQNSSISDSTVASQYATSILNEFYDASIRAGFDLMNYSTQIEATTPIPLLNIFIKQDKYAEKRFGEGLYSGLVNFDINRINYNLSNNSGLKTSIDLGKPRPKISETFSAVLYELDQVRSATL
jgi:hypothetical protein